MPIDDDDDLFNEEFDLVDDDDYDDDSSDDASRFDDEETAQDSFSEDENKEEEVEKPKRTPAKKKSSPRGRRRPKAASKNGAADDKPDTVLESADSSKPVEDGESNAESSGETAKDPKAGEGDDLDEFGRPKPEANYVVHVYEHNSLNRTIDRPFTPEDAEAFVTEYNRTGKVYGRLAVAGKNDAKPKKTVD